MNQFATFCFALFCIQVSSGQVTMQSSENSNYYSVNVPSAQISFHRNFNGNVSSLRFLRHSHSRTTLYDLQSQLSQQHFLNPEPLAQYAIPQPLPASQHVNMHAFNAFPASQAEPQRYYMERLQQPAAVQVSV